MIWFFDRHGQRLRYEIRRSEEGGFELVVTQPDGRVLVEQTTEPAALLRRSAELADSLKEAGWTLA